ncbi:MAG: hypothetical protein JWO36_3865 [Myxococcales bacterium]|nr:hypothetical protein [Myxococcales bacterium]
MLPIGEDDRRGVTDSERYLFGLCERSFLRLWSHPNVYRRPHKELCDLLVLFGEDIIIFQDKSCTYKPGPHGWTRWYRHSIEAAAHQLHQSARWVRTYPDCLYLDRQCVKPFPFPLPKQPRIHLVAIALGASEACRAHFHEGSGSLILAPALPADGTTPFHVSDLDRSKDFVHVFDDVSLDTVLAELDTIDDFVAYLVCKERFVRSGKLISADGEEDLLGYYLTHIDSTGHHDFVVEPHTYIAVENYWSGLSKHAGYLAKKQHDQVSYLWDKIIDSVADGALSGTLNYQADPGIQATEKLLRFLAREPRVIRRGLARALMGAFAESDRHERTFRQLSPGDKPDMAYVFAIIRRGSWCRSEDHYREQRRNILSAYMEVMKLRLAHVKLVVGLGFGGSDEQDGSVDCLASHFEEPWSSEMIREVDALRIRMGWGDLGDLELVRQREYEYPEVATPTRTTPSRSESPAAKRKRARKAQKQARRRNR